jgi:hypothetical protein
MIQIGQNLWKLHFNERDTRALHGDIKLSTRLYNSHQTCVSHEYFLKTLHSQLAKNHLAIVFQMDVKTVRKYLRRGRQDPESALTAFIIHAFNKGKAMTKRRVLALVCEPYSPERAKGWLDTCVGHHLDALYIYRSLP